MLELKKTAIFLDDDQLEELERIVIRQDTQEAFRFLRENIYEEAVRFQRSL